MTTFKKLPTISPSKVQVIVKKKGRVGRPWLDCSACARRRQITEPNIKIGRYMAIINPPIRIPSTDMMMGSISCLF